ncbi:MAG: NADH:flavin oxidoreductase, partial [Methylocella sp.]
YVPVLMEGRIIAGYATVHRDEFIQHWRKLGEAVHSFDCKYIMQLSHSGRQMDIPGVHNYTQRALSSTSRKETLHGILCRAMSLPEIHHTIKAFARGAWRAREAGLDGVELHAANGYLFTQFLSSGINDRTDEYGGSLANRARFLLDVIQAIRAEVGGGYHLQVKISAVDHNNVIPWEGKGNTLQESVEVARWCEAAGADAIHVSTGSLFPHPLNPPGDFSFETAAATYDVAISSGVDTFRNYLLFRYPVLRPIFRWLWFRMKRGRPVEGVGLDEARAIKAAVKIPVISTGGWQSAAKIRGAINSGDCDGVAIARSLIANPDLVRFWAAGDDLPPRPCTYCNRCLLNAPKNPLGCYEPLRFPDHETMVEQLMTVYNTHPELRVPQPAEVFP